MKFLKTKLEGAYIISPEIIEDKRGFFTNVWNHNQFQTNNLNTNLTECNVAFNIRKGTVRGLHYQTSPFSGAKLIRCTSGKIFDVVLDLRPNSNTFKKWYSVELSAENHLSNYVPEGCAHGYQTLEDHSEVFYLMSQVYDLKYEQGILYSDPAFDISLPLKISLISKKDLSWKLFSD